jgi:predicted acetyltransferase
MSPEARLDQLRLRPPQLGDEAAVKQAHVELTHDHFDFAIDLDTVADWAGYIARADEKRRGVNLAADRVPATFLLATVGEEVVGRTSIRHELNEFLSQRGGHIGYAVRPAFRQRGYATEILRQSLIVARSIGIQRALITCDDTNAASAKTIERCGGVQHATFTEEDGNVVRQYWIE